MSLRVVAILTAIPGTEDEMRAVLEALLHPTREEDGCLHYEMMVNRDDPTEFVFVEEWTDEAALDAHLGTPHIQAAAAALASLQAAHMDLRKYDLVG